MDALDETRRSLSSLEAAAAAELKSWKDVERRRDGDEGNWRRRRMLANVADMLRSMPTKWEEIEAAAEMANTPEEETRLLEELEARKKTHDALRREWKRAQVQARKRAAQDEQDVRASLLEGAKEEVQDVSRSTTDTLQATRALMQQELGRGSAAVEALQVSDEKLQHANRKVKDTHPLLKTSKKLMKIIYRNDVSERASLYLGFSLFMGVVAYILAKRLVGIDGWHPSTLWRTETKLARKEGMDIPSENLERKDLHRGKGRTDLREGWGKDPPTHEDAWVEGTGALHAEPRREYPRERDEDALVVEEVYTSQGIQEQGEERDRPKGVPEDDADVLELEKGRHPDDVDDHQAGAEDASETVTEPSGGPDEKACTSCETDAGQHLFTEESPGSNEGGAADSSSATFPEEDIKGDCSESLCILNFDEEDEDSAESGSGFGEGR